jgi:hypothetical protein
MLSSQVRQQIIDYATQNGIDPAYMLATAERESGFNPNLGGTGTIKGAYQMTRALRQQYGIPEQGATLDQQNRGFAAYTNDLRGNMRKFMGRDPSDSELYMGHHFGPYRASKMATGAYHPNTPVTQVFSPLELRGNPHIVRAGTTGRLAQNTLSDMDRRLAKHGGQGGGPVLAGGPPGRGDPDNAIDDFSEYAEGYDKNASATPTDFSEYAEQAAPKQQPSDKIEVPLPPDVTRETPGQQEQWAPSWFAM